MKNLSIAASILLFAASILFVKFVFAEESVMINEIAWMGTKNSSFDEWMELYNPTGEEISLQGWLLYNKGKDLKISLEGTIPKKGYYLLERTDESTLPESSSDIIYSGGLKNSGESLFLENKEGVVIDSAIFSSGWPQGDNNAKKTMERKEDREWQTSRLPEGTPGEKNSQGNAQEKDPVLTGSPSPKKSEKVSIFEDYSSNIPPAEALQKAFLLSIFSGGSILAIKKSLI